MEFLRENADCSTEQHWHDMNHFMARLIFCFFAEDTGIFRRTGLFTAKDVISRNSNNSDT